MIHEEELEIRFKQLDDYLRTVNPVLLYDRVCKDYLRYEEFTKEFERYQTNKRELAAQRKREYWMKCQEIRKKIEEE